jgi:tetratricopeptide (TPR) repeat protein
MTEVDAAVPDSLAVRFSASNASQLVQEGLQRYQSGQFAAVVTVWRQAVDAFAAQGDRFNQAMVLSNLALAYHQLGQWNEANEAIGASLAIASHNATSLQLRQREGAGSDSILRLKILAQALNAQGKLQLAQGQAEQALTSWQKAAEAYEQAADKTGVARSLINQAQALRVLGFYQRVKDSLEQANKILQDQPDSAIKAAGLLSFGDALRLVGDLNESQKKLHKSLEIAHRLQSPPAITAAQMSLGNTAYANAQMNLGNSADTKEQFKAAFEYYQQAIASSTSPTTTLQAQLNQLRLLIETKEWAEARALGSKIQTQLANLPISRTAIYARINFIQSLMKLWNQKLEVGSPEAPTPQTAAKILATAVQQAKELKDQQAESYALGYLGQIYEQTQQLRQIVSSLPMEVSLVLPIPKRLPC